MKAFIITSGIRPLVIKWIALIKDKMNLELRKRFRNILFLKDFQKYYKEREGNRS